MASTTKSELLFEKLCSILNIPFSPVETDSDKTPDYDIFIHKKKVIIEIKQMDPNKSELKKHDEFNEYGRLTIKNKPGERVRGKIKDATGKFRKRMAGMHPSILVLYNNVKLYKHTASYDILAGMYGRLSFSVIQPAAPDMPFEINDMEFGAKKSMTNSDNTSISAVGVLETDKNGKPRLTIYHNLYAEVPLDPCLLSKFPIKQYKICSSNSTKWEEIQST